MTPAGRARDGAGDSVLAMFARQVALTPDAIAVEDRGVAISYRALAARSARLAAELASRGASRNRVVGLCVDRSARLPIAILAILAAGAAYLPLDPAYPAARRSFMLTDSEATVVLAQADLITDLDVPAGVHVIDIDSLRPDADADADADHGPVHGSWPSLEGDTAGPDDLVYVMYTSGSTGVPKGVAMPHRAMTTLIGWQVSASRCGVAARTVQFSAASFDASFQEMFSTWAAGGTLVMIPEPIRRDAGRLLGFLVERRIERIFLPFVALQSLAQQADRAKCYPLALRVVITAGEQLVVTPALRALFARCHHARLTNQYGPSETHIVTSLALGPDPTAWPELPAIGVPIDGTRITVVDERGDVVTDGVTGEIVIAGNMVGRGYVGRPALTADRFRPEQAGPPGARAYRSGDLGRIEPDGTIAWLGRRDHQLKIRGFRVEVGEVEAAVKSLPGVPDGVVVVTSGPDGKRLVAFVESLDRSARNLLEQLRRTLPDYLVPVAVVVLDRLPLTPSGKVDRLGLATRPVVVTGSAGDSEVPVEEAAWAPLAGLWREVTGAEGVGAHDSFFDLGGSSLSGMVLIEKLTAHRSSGAAASDDLDLDVLLDHPTPAAMAAWLGWSDDPAASITGDGQS